MKIVAVVGMCGAGKSEVTSFFEARGYHKIYFGDITMIELKARGLAINADNEKLVREDLREKYGKASYAVKVAEQIEEQKHDYYVLDGLYSWSEYQYLHGKYSDHLQIVAVITNDAIRKARLKERPVRPLTAQEVDKRDVAEIENLEKGGPIAKADYYILNNGSVEQLQVQCQNIYQSIDD